MSNDFWTHYELRRLNRRLGDPRPSATKLIVFIVLALFAAYYIAVGGAKLGALAGRTTACLFPASYKGRAMPDMMTPDGPSAVYLSARREWNERYGSHISRERWWRAAALVALAANLGLSAELVWKAQQSSVVPYIVERDKLGETYFYGQIRPPAPPNASDIRDLLRRFVCDVHTVYADPYAERTVGIEAFGYIDRNSEGYQQMLRWFSAHDPNADAKKEHVGCKTDAVNQVGVDTWTVDYTEEHWPSDARPAFRTYWRQTIRVRVSAPTTAEEIQANPHGIWITWAPEPAVRGGQS